MAALSVLGLDEMLNRPDALPTLNHREARVLFAALAPALPPIPDTFARAALPY